MMIVDSIEKPGVEIDSGFSSEGLQKVANQVGGKTKHIIIANRISPTAQVHNHHCQGIIHRHSGISHPDNAPFLTQRLSKGLT